jgi:hypothetical protein
MTTQISNIRKHLQAGNTITPAEAMIVFGCMRLAAAIEDLRREGMDIDTVMCLDATGKKYARYSLRRPVVEGAKVQVRLGHAYGLPKWVRKAKDAIVKVIHQDVAYVEFTRGTLVVTHPLNVKELVRV